MVWENGGSKKIPPPMISADGGGDKPKFVPPQMSDGGGEIENYGGGIEMGGEDGGGIDILWGENGKNC